MTCRKCSRSTPAITKIYMMLTNSLHRVLAHLRLKKCQSHRVAVRLPECPRKRA